MDAGEIKDVLAQNVFEGDIANKKGSTFMGFAAHTADIQTVRKVYKQLKYRFPEATHIMCAYRIEGEDVIHMQDAVDGGEGGGGTAILDMMVKDDFKNCMAAVVRHHDGPNIGPSRFDMIADVAKSALDTLPSTLAVMNFSIHRAPSSVRGGGARFRGGSTAARPLFQGVSSPASGEGGNKRITSVAV